MAGGGSGGLGASEVELGDESGGAAAAEVGAELGFGRGEEGGGGGDQARVVRGRDGAPVVVFVVVVEVSPPVGAVVGLAVVVVGRVVGVVEGVGVILVGFGGRDGTVRRRR